MASDFIVDGRPAPDSAEEILDDIIADAKTAWGSDLNDTEEAIIREFYDLLAARIEELHNDMASVLDAAQIDYATGKALDLKCEGIGVHRKSAAKATGTVTFSRSSNATVDYVIPANTVVQTDNNDPIEFITTDAVTLSSGTSSVDAAVKAVEGGVDGNLGANTLIILPDPPSGVEEVTNAAETTGGKDREDDEELRQRAKNELANGARATISSLEDALKGVDGVTSVDVIENDTDSADGDGRPSHSVEHIVAGTFVADDVAQAILDKKAGGMPAVGGYVGTSTNGTATLDNGDTKTITFSTASDVQIFVDVDIQTLSTYGGDDEVRDAIVQYIGGILSSGNENPNGLSIEEDVIYGQIDFAVRSVEGVYDITSLTIGTSASPVGTSNITINTGEIATADATDGSITIATTAV